MCNSSGDGVCLRSETVGLAILELITQNFEMGDLYNSEGSNMHMTLREGDLYRLLALHMAGSEADLFRLLAHTCLYVKGDLVVFEPGAFICLKDFCFWFTAEASCCT